LPIDTVGRLNRRIVGIPSIKNYDILLNIMVSEKIFLDMGRNNYFCEKLVLLLVLPLRPPITMMTYFFGGGFLQINNTGGLCSTGG
jgi:hypothetical protein